MRILTVRHPWAAALIFQARHLQTGEPILKDVENRSRNVAGAYRGPVAIHAALQYDEPAFHRTGDVLSDWWDTADVELEATRGHIIGVADLVDVHHGPEFGGGCHKLSSPLPVLPDYGLCSPWGDAGAYHLVFANPRPLVDPVPYRGGQGMRRLPEGMSKILADHLRAAPTSP